MTTPPPPPDAETHIIEPGSPPPPGAPPVGGPDDYEPEPSRGLGWGMLLGALLLVAIAAVIAAVYFLTRDNGNNATTTTTTTAATTTAPVIASSKVFVPDVTGLKQDEAASRLGAAHLVPVVEFKATKKPTGLVVSQDPKAAKRVNKGTNVTIVVDRGAPSVPIPDVTGMKVADAGKRLTDAGLKPQTTQVTAAGKAPGTVVSQAPAAGTQGKKGSVVTLSVAKAPAGATTSATTTSATTTQATTTTAATTSATTTSAAPPAKPTTATVPDLSGMDLQAASQALAGASLLATVQYVPAQDPLETVEDQSPAANATAPARSHVTVNVSTGPGNKPQKTVPNAVGQTLDQSVSTMNGAGLRLIFVKVPVTTRAQVGKIVEQTPKAGQTAPQNAQVLVYLGVLK